MLMTIYHADDVVQEDDLDDLDDEVDKVTSVKKAFIVIKKCSWLLMTMILMMLMKLPL